MKTSRINDTIDHISNEAIIHSTVKLVPERSVLCVVRSGVLKHTFPVAITECPVAFNQDICALVPGEDLLAEFIHQVLVQSESLVLSQGVKRGGTVHSLHNGFLANFKIPQPPQEIQRQIVAELEVEWAMVESNRKLIELFEKKIQAKLAEIWGEEANDAC